MTTDMGESAAESASPPVDGERLEPAMELPLTKDAFPIVGIGASAGGLEAFTQLLAHLPSKSGMAFVLVQHLDPNHESQLTDLLSKATVLPVVEVTDGLAIGPDQIYVIPPNVNMAIAQGVLRLTPRGEGRGQHLPLDIFFRSLAAERQSQAIGVILSGTGSDGTLGLAEIKAVGGITFAQDEKSARYAGMPLNAINSGCVDFVLPPDQIAAELARIGQHPYLQPAAAAPTGAESDDAFQKILARLRTTTGVDFSHYRQTTLQRRLARRLALHRKDSLAEYLRFMEENPAEVEVLYRDILINVTSFFRDGEVFEALKTDVFPEIVKGKSPETPIRVWVPGCSTGQEVYSLAIALLEFLDQSSVRPPIQVFGTDINDAVAIEKARLGLYPHSIEAEITPARLQRFFSKEAGGYRIGKSIRDMCVFARQNVVADPPFSRLDLVSCRNVLIYLSGTLQKRIIPTFHYALNAGGFLLLGQAETVGRFSDLFTVVDQKHSIFAKTPTLARTYPYFATDDYHGKGVTTPGAPVDRTPSVADVQKEADRVVLGRYAPAGVLINEDMEILQFRGRTGAYLEPAPGEASYNLLRMARQSLFVELRSAVDEARKQNATVRRQGIRLHEDQGVRSVNIEVIPIRTPGAAQRCFLVLFEEAPATSPAAAPPRPPTTLIPPEDELVSLRQELASTKEYLQAIIEQQSAANEELKSANEEILSSNEELQSTNEEMQTAKEELQSTNEELQTVNDELQNRNHEIGQLNDDLTNILASVKIPIVTFGADLRVRRFTPAAAGVMNLLATDLGRPLGDIKPGIHFPDLEAMLLDVIATVAPQEREVQDRHGRWYLMRLHPYRTADHRIDGAVLALLDIDKAKQAEDELKQAHHRLTETLEAITDAFFSTDRDFVVTEVNLAAERILNKTREQLLGNNLWEQFPEARDSRFHREYVRALTEGIAVHFEEYYPPLAVWFEVHAYPSPSGLAVYFHDITLRKQAEEHLQAGKAAAEAASHAKDHFLAVLSHELRNPLTPVLTTTSLLLKDPRFDADTRAQLAMIQRNAELEARLIDDLLDLTRIARGKIELGRRPVDLLEVIRRAVEVCMPDIETRKLEFGMDAPGGPYIVMGDADRLQQVFWNLLRNAIKFTPVGGCVGIRCRADGENQVVAEVNDSGMGIEPEVLARIFNAFEQAERSITRRFGGLGLGLSISRTMVELHGGSIEAHSPGKDRGATFRVRLPLMAAAESAIAAAPAAQPQHPMRPLRILLVEDHGDTARIMKRLLAGQGHQVEAAADVATALQMAEAGRFDLLLSDLGLPDGSGLDLMRALRTRGLDLPGIALSGYGQDEDVVQSREAGFAAHLTKPVHPSTLQAAIRKVTDGSQAPPAGAAEPTP